MKPDEAFKEWAVWSFGDAWVHFFDSRGKILVKAWNRRHGGLLILKEDGIIKHDLQKMVKIWIEETQEKPIQGLHDDLNEAKEMMNTVLSRLKIL